MDNDGWGRARAVLEGLPGPAVLATTDGMLIGANAAFARAVGGTRAALGGRPLGAFVAEEPGRLSSYLNRCSGSRMAIPGALILRGADLVLMDIRLGGDADGIDAAADLRTRLGTPVIFISANLDAETSRRAQSVDPVAIVNKPFAPSGVLQRGDGFFS